MDKIKAMKLMMKFLTKKQRKKQKANLVVEKLRPAVLYQKRQNCDKQLQILR